MNKHTQQPEDYPHNTGSFADLSEDEKKKRLDAMVRIWQSDTQRRMERGGGEDLPAFLKRIDFCLFLSLPLLIWKNMHII